MKIEWGWNDGYVRNIPKQHVDIPDEELEGLSDEAREDFIEEYVRIEFENKVTYWWKAKK